MENNVKKFLLKCCAFFLILTFIFVPFSYFTDPYNVFHADHPVDNGVEPNKNYIKPRHVMKNPDMYDSFLFGSSRVGFLDVSMMNDGTYYDMMASEGLPAEHLQILKEFIKRGIVPKNVVIGVDDISYFVDPSTHDNVLYRKMYPFDGTITDQMAFFLRYIDPVTTVRSLKTIQNHEKNEDGFEKRLLTTGTENLDIVSQFDEKNNFPYWADYYMPRDEVFDEIQQIIDLCDENNIHLTFFTNPLFGQTYTKDIENGYLVFLDKLADITDFYNFSGYNDMTMDTANYYENSHYTRAIGDKMIEVMFENKTEDHLLEQGFGYYVTKENKEDFLQILNEQAVNFDIDVNSYADTLNKEEQESVK